MARKKRKRRAKKWYELVAPEMFGKSPVGDILADDPSKLIDRTVETTLGDLIGEQSKQHITLIFKVSDIADGIANTKFIRHEMDKNYMSGFVRKRNSLVYSNTNVVTSDKYEIRVKSLCFTLRKASSSKIKDIRRTLEKIVKSRAEELRFGQFVQEIVLGKLASDAYKEVRRVHPIRRLEINKAEVMSEPAG